MRQRLAAALVGVVCMISLGACTNGQIGAWLNWWEDDPDAAVEFAQQDWVQQSLASRSGGNSGGSSGSSSSTGGGGGDGGKWDVIAECESNGNWSINTGNGYSGGLQFLHSTWRAYGGQEFAPLAYQASKSEQIIVAERVLDDAGWGAWPTCSRRAGYR